MRRMLLVESNLLRFDLIDGAISVTVRDASCPTMSKVVILGFRAKKPPSQETPSTEKIRVLVPISTRWRVPSNGTSHALETSGAPSRFCGLTSRA